MKQQQSHEVSLSKQQMISKYMESLNHSRSKYVNQIVVGQMRANLNHCQWGS